MTDFEQQNKVSPEVIHSVGSQVNLDWADIETLKSLALNNPRRRVRFCSHHSGDELVHEMFIVHPINAYVRPHKHLDKIESMLVLHGEVDYVTFDDHGGISDSIPMGDFSSGKIFYKSLRTGIYHSLLIKSEWLVFLEITQGPFNKEDTFYAEWSPVDDTPSVESFMHSMRRVENE